MRIEWLRTFLALAETGDSGAVEHELDRSESRIQTNITLLEDYCQVPLFGDRNEWVLTPAGTVLLPKVRTTLTDIDEFERIGKPRRRLRLVSKRRRAGRWDDADIATVKRDLRRFVRQVDSILAQSTPI